MSTCYYKYLQIGSGNFFEESASRVLILPSPFVTSRRLNLPKYIFCQIGLFLPHIQCSALKLEKKNSVVTSGCTIKKSNVFWKIWKNFTKHFEFSLFKKVCKSKIMSPKIVPFFHFRPHCSHVAFQKGRFFREIQDTNLS